jgi:hypothetical protein
MERVTVFFTFAFRNAAAELLKDAIFFFPLLFARCHYNVGRSW